MVNKMKILTSLGVPVLFFTSILLGCSGKPTAKVCGTEEAQNLLIKETEKLLPESLKKLTSITIASIEETPAEDKGSPSCKSVVKVSFSDDTRKKYSDFLEGIKKTSAFKAEYRKSLEDEPLEQQITWNYKLKKNEATGGNFIEGESETGNLEGLSKKVVEIVQNYDEATQGTKEYEAMFKLHEYLVTKSRTGKSVISYLTDNKLVVEYCNLYEAQNDDLGVNCRVSNNYASVDMYKGNFTTEYKKILVEIFGEKDGGIDMTKKIKTPAKILEIINQSEEFISDGDGLRYFKNIRGINE